MKALLTLFLAPGLLAQPDRDELKKVERYASIIGVLTDPKKLSTLKGKRLPQAESKPSLLPTRPP